MSIRTARQKSPVRIFIRILTIILIALVIMSGAPFCMSGNLRHINAETDQADWSGLAHPENFWGVGSRQRLHRVLRAEPIRQPSLQYIGSFTNGEGRTVIRLSFRMYRSSTTAVWHNLILKPDAPLTNKIDWSKSSIYRNLFGDSHHCRYPENTSPPPGHFSVPTADVGSADAREIDLVDNGNVKAPIGMVEYPIDIVLNDGETLESLPSGAIIHARMSNGDRGSNSYEQLYTSRAAGAGGYGYYTYTWSARIPSSAASFWKFNTLDDIKSRARASSFTDSTTFSSNSYTRFGEDPFGRYYVEVVHKQAKSATSNLNYMQEAYAFRQVFSRKFYDLLKPVHYIKDDATEEENVFALVYVADQNDNPYAAQWNAGTQTPKENNCIRITRDDINQPNDNFRYIEVARQGDDGFVKTGESTQSPAADPHSKVAVTDQPVSETFLNSGASGGAGYSTITRYYIDENKITDTAFNDIMFYSAILTSNTAKPNAGYMEYKSTSANEDILLPAGSKVRLLFDEDTDWKGGTNFGELQIKIGNEEYGSIDFRSNIAPDTAITAPKKRQFFWTVPSNIKIPAGTAITILGDRVSRGSTIGRIPIYYENPVRCGITMSDASGKQIARFDSPEAGFNKDPQVCEFSDSIVTFQNMMTLLKPNIQEIFTDSNQIVAHSYYDGASINLRSAEGGVHGDIPYNQASEQVLVKGNYFAGYKFAFNESDFDDTIFPAVMWPRLEKDMPIYFRNIDRSHDGLPSSSVIEQVQAKVVFDLNGGTMPSGGTEAPLSYSARNSSSDPVTRVAPLNKNYLKIRDASGAFVANTQYKANGFEAAAGAEDNRRLVNGVLADHDGEQLSGNNLFLRQFVSQIPTAPAGKRFKEWNTMKDGSGTKFERTTEITNAMTVYAIYEDDVPIVATGVKPAARTLLWLAALLSLVITCTVILRRKLGGRM